jgi:hypothetical protein
LMINFLPAPIFGFAFFVSPFPFSRSLFAIVEIGCFSAMYRMVSCGRSIVVLRGDGVLWTLSNVIAYLRDVIIPYPKYYTHYMFVSDIGPSIYAHETTLR